jgi:hypothetical protein
MSLLADAVVARLKLLATGDVGNKTPMELVRYGYCDPVRVFVKNEPHKREKLASGRVRLISNVSLVDQLVERYLFSSQNEAEIKHYTEIPSKPGMGLHDDGISEIYTSVRQLGSDLAEADFSSFDWTVQEWELQADVSRRIDSLGINPTSSLAQAMTNRVHCLCWKVFILSDGTVLEQQKPGIQASGSYNTSSTNSWIRVFLAKLAGVECIAMGDDSVEVYSERAREIYTAYGHICKVYKRASPENFNFCSQTFTANTAFPEQPWKALTKLLYSKEKLPEKQLLYEQWKYENRANPMIEELIAIIEFVQFLS